MKHTTHPQGRIAHIQKSAAQEEVFPLAGLMYANVNVYDQEKPNHQKPETENTFPLPAGGMKRIATNGNRTAWAFATSTREGLLLAGSWANFDVENLIKPNIENLTKPHLCNLSKPDIFALYEDKNGPIAQEFSEAIKKGSASRSDHQRGKACYIPFVAAKSATGIETPSKQKATQTPKASFFVSNHYAHPISGIARTVSMVALVGLRSRRPVPFCAGSLNPANVTAKHDIETSGGDSLQQKEAATMATIPTQKPSFIWLIGAVRRDMPTITAKIHHIAAESEQEARRSLSREHVTFFAGRIRQGVDHA